MKHVILILLFSALALPCSASLREYSFKPMREKIRYKEEFYQLYAEWLYADFDSITRNIWFLELASVVPFDHPIKALVPVTNEMQYARYQNLVNMDICRLLTKAYLDFANQYMKEHIYFYNAEFMSNYLEGYEIADAYFDQAKNWWDKAVTFAQAADTYKGWRIDGDFRGHHFNFENTMYRIKSGDLNYYKVIAMRKERVAKNRKIIDDYLSK